ncbi:MAG TPA: SET domain-containing protein [Niabella sp.]|nr:SET domain-containing protein [Niabella sp.]HOZ98126.1 SET domain-containing protein [Niabella sp.]HQW16130.1 SET domain-containing protein [Niabella sp.]HQX21342.1 SET domain-containing protein [Niabella sp.]HRB08125.1 SET domain-containing protein [Niabella sp.]
MIAHYLFIAETTQMGKGVFTAEKISKNTVIEIAPVVVMSGEERKLLDQTLLHDYIFEWGEESQLCCVALGWVSMYNHSYESNCEYDMDDDSKTITIRTVRPIMAGEELYINYNGVWNSDKKVWFDAR